MFSSADHRPLERRLVALALLGAAVLAPATGCAPRQPQPVTRPPLIVDEAMQRRDWERSVAWYPNGDTVSGHNRFPIRTSVEPGTNEYGAAAFDIVASMAQTVALPFTYIFIPPFSRAVYRGEDIGPTYTGMPNMRPPRAGVYVDGLLVERDTLEVIGRPAQGRDERYRRHGPQGPGDIEFMPGDAGPDAPAAEGAVRGGQRQRHYGPQGPGDTEFMSSEPSPADAEAPAPAEEFE